MSDGNEVDLMKMATHTASGIGGAGLIGVLMRFFQSREAQQAREEFVELRGDVKRLIDDIGEHKRVFEDVVGTKMSVSALHKRLDEYEKRLDRVEGRKR
jgi:uncharacterized protein Yka (UPF0111/DUF47 family)